MVRRPRWTRTRAASGEMSSSRPIDPRRPGRTGPAARSPVAGRRAGRRARPGGRRRCRRARPGRRRRRGTRVRDGADRALPAPASAAGPRWPVRDGRCRTATGRWSPRRGRRTGRARSTPGRRSRRSGRWRRPGPGSVEGGSRGPCRRGGRTGSGMRPSCAVVAERLGVRPGLEAAVGSCHACLRAGSVTRHGMATPIPLQAGHRGLRVGVAWPQATRTGGMGWATTAARPRRR